MGSRKRHRGRYSVSLVALATALFFIPGVPAAVGAETHEVACPSDSLQDAIDAAAPGDTIVFSGTCMENVVVNTTLSLLGSGTATIDGGGVGTVIEFKAAADAHLESFSVANGAAPHGAGIRIHVGASVDGSYLVIRDNSASIGGGAVFNEGDLDLEHSIVTDNVTATTEWGDVLLAAGIANSGVVSLHDVEFSGNSGDYVGAIGNSDTGTLTITASHFHDQGSYYEYEPGWWVIDSAGEIGGAIANRGIATVSDTFFERNHAWSSGGAIHNVGDLTVERSSFVENRTDDAGGGSGGGAGIYSFGQARITDADFIGNIAWEDPGAGVMNYGVMEIARSTFTNNLS